MHLKDPIIVGLTQKFDFLEYHVNALTDLLSFVSIQGQVVCFAPVHQMFHLFHIGRVVVITDKAHYYPIIRKLHNLVSSGPGTAVVGHQGEQQWTKDIHTCLFLPSRSCRIGWSAEEMASSAERFGQ